MKRAPKKIAPTQPQESAGPGCGCVLMGIGLCISAVFIIFIVTVVNRPPKPEPELSGAAGHTDLHYNPQRVEETKALIHHMAKELAFPDSQKGLEIVKATGFRAADVRSQLEGKSSYLSDIVLTGRMKNVGLAGAERIDVPSFDAELAMIRYCLDLCRASEGESSVAGSRAYVRRLSDELGYSQRRRVGQKHPASDFPADQIESALRQLEESYSTISRHLKESQADAGKPEDGFAAPSKTLNSDEDLLRIRYCRETFRSTFPNEFEAADPLGAKLRESAETMRSDPFNRTLPFEVGPSRFQPSPTTTK